jgi:hypothetical protein
MYYRVDFGLWTLDFGRWTFDFGLFDYSVFSVTFVTLIVSPSKLPST